MIDLYSYTERFSQVRPLFERLLNGLNKAMADFEKHGTQLSEEQKTKLEGLKQALTTLSDPNGKNLPKDQVGGALNFLKKNVEFFHHKVGEKSLIEQFDIDDYYLEEIDKGLNASISFSKANRYEYLYRHINALNPEFRNQADAKAFLLFKMALNLYYQTEPGYQDPDGQDISIAMPFGKEELVIPNKETAYRILDKYSKDIWNIKLGAEGGDKTLKDLFRESAPSEEEKSYLKDLADFCVDDRETVQNDIDELDDMYKKELPDEIQLRMGADVGEELLQGSFDVFAEEKTMDGIGKIPSSQGKNAKDWITDYKRVLRGANQENLTADERTNYIARIMAARLLVNATRGKSETLNVQISEKQIREMAGKLKENETFSAWMDQLNEDPEAIAKVVSSLHRGYGGAIEDQFKKYVKTLPAGELHTVPPLERYLPTAKERIEELRDQFKNLGNQPDAENAKAKTVLEILAIRNAVHAHRKHKSSLDKPIPVRVDIAEVTNKLHSDERLQELALTDNVTRQVKEGHGGVMCEKLLEGYRKVGEQELYSQTQLEADTVGGYMNNLRVQAAELVQYYKENVLTQGNPSQKELRDKLLVPGKELMKQYLALSGSLWNKQGQYIEGKINDHVNWKKLAQDGQSIESGKLVENLTEKLNVDKLLEALTNLAIEDRKTYYPKVTGLYSENELRRMELESVKKKQQKELAQDMFEFRVEKISGKEKNAADDDDASEEYEDPEVSIIS